MNKVILCEGMTDAVLLSYYLERVAGWSFCKKPPKNIAIKEDSFEQSVNWYEKGKDRLLICAVGGKDNLGSFFKKKILRAIIDAGAFSKIALILDRDNNEVKSIEKHVSLMLRPVVTQVKNNCWLENHYTDSFNSDQIIDALLVVIPTEHEGALETLMLDSISEDPYDAVIVDKAKDFVESMSSIASKYITNNRVKLKAHLGITWAVQYPEKVFRLINEQIQSVKWEESAVLRKCFEQLVNI